MKKHSRFNRILSGILAFVLLLPPVPVRAESTQTENGAELPPAASVAAEPRITREGEAVRKLSLASHERIEILAEHSEANASYQWQILHPEKPDVWINISDATHSDLFVTLALVRNMMTEDQTARLRCRVTAGGQMWCTDPVTVEYCPDMPYAAEKPSETTPAETVPETIPVETMEETVPVETEAPTVPAETVPETVPVETVEETVPAETEAPTVPAETVLETVPVETEEETIPAETEAPTVPAETIPETTPVETVEETVPAETEAPTVPAETIPETTPVETEEATIPAETEAPTVPAETVLETVPVETVEETVPVETEAPTVPTETVPETLPAPVVFVEEAAASVAADVPVNPEASEFVSVIIDYVRFDFARDEKGALIPDTGEGSYHGYQLEDEGTVAFTSYKATLQYGTDLDTTVSVPTLVGYTPYLEDGADAITEVAISEGNIKEDIRITVKYKPAKVKYTVRYYFQNIYDDLYVENTTLKIDGEGFTGSVPPADQLKKEVSGFTSLYYQPDSIAADGSTVFEVYYERNYYLMEFDCNGGYGTDTLYSRYGSYINVPSPVLSGYVFGGWDKLEDNDNDPETPREGDGISDALFTEMPEYNTAYKAIWTTGATSYTVVYWRENANDNGYSYWDSVTVGLGNNGQPDGSVRSNELVSGTDHQTANGLTEYQYFTYNPVMTELEEAKRTDLRDGKVVVQGDGSTVVNVYYSRNYYTITFKATGTCTAHVHGADCVKQLLCGQDNHVHDDSCIKTLVCTIPEHTAHTGDCLICDITEHTHSDACCNLMEHVHTTACCSKEEHTHSIICYTASTGYSPAGNNDNGFRNYISEISNPKAGYVYRYYNYYNYFYDGTTWYYLGSNNQYRGLCDREADFEYVSERITVCETKSPIENCDRTEHMHGDGTCNTSKCGLTPHTHGDGNCNCTIPEHTHTDSCYSDSLHTHVTSCYNYECTNLHEHTDACYGACIYPDHTHTNSCNRNQENTIKQVTRKYDADITKIWEEDPIKTYLQDGIVWQSDITEDYYSFLEKMPNSDIKLTYTVWSGNTYTWYYYLEISPFEDTTGLITRTDDLVTYKLYHTTSVNGNNIRLTYAEDYFPITGYTQRDATVPSFSNNRTAYLYYRIKKDLKLTYYNRSEDSPAPAVQNNIYFNQPLKSLEVSADVMQNNYYPVGIEPGAYEFAGWYTTPGCYPGSEVEWETLTMSDSDLEIYAKWTPVRRNVTFYTLYEDIGKQEGEEGYHAPFLTAPDVPHGSILGTAYNKNPSEVENPDPRISGYTFIGWFYMDEDNKKRFAPDSMEIDRDLVLFAEWKTSIDTTYEIQYVLAEAYSTDDGTTYPAGTQIADGIFAHASVGMTKTFTAKGNTDLYTPFQKNFYPMVNSHSILMKEEDAENTFTFEYRYDERVFYKVRYLEASTNKELADPFETSTSDSVITVKFKPISGYLPQSYYIRKTLAYDGDATSAIEENIITFYYVKDEDHGIYSVEYYLENASGEYTLYENIVGTADKDTTYPPTGTNLIRAYEGYDHDPSQNTVITYNENGEATEQTNVANEKLQGIVTPYGLTFKLYYKRKLYPYSVEYWVAGSDIDADKIFENGFLTVGEGTNQIVPHTDTAYFDTEQSWSLIQRDADGALIRDHSTIEVAGNTYEFYPNDPANPENEKTKTITIRTDEMENRIIFYFIQKRVAVFYHAVCTEPALNDICGAVSLASEDADTLVGSRAIPKTGFVFKGWYKDEACEESDKVADGWLKEDDPNHLIPKERYQNTNDDDPGNDWINHYYALFEPVKEAITIRKTGDDLRDNTFLFQVTGTNVLGEAVAMTVSIHGAGSVTIQDLYCGSYTVKELTDWSWAYECTGDKEQKVTLITGDQDEQGNPITTYQMTFTNKAKTVDWLHGEGSADNRFK